MKNLKVSSVPLDTMGLLGALFIGLKLIRVIDWSWVWVTAPFWGPVAILAVILAFYCMFILMSKLCSFFRRKRA